MHIFFFTQSYPPEIGAAPLRAHFHAKKWLEMGHRVTVITNVPNSPYGKIYTPYKNKFIQTQMLEGIEVIRLFTVVSGKKSPVLRRFMGSMVYLFMSFTLLFRKKPDIVLGSAPFFAGFAAYFHAKLKRIPIVYELRDPWLPVIIDSGARFSSILKFVLKLLFKLEKRMLKRVDRAVVIGKQMSRYIQEKYMLQSPPDIIYNGIIPEDFTTNSGAIPGSITPLLEYPLKVAFLGNLGNQYDMDTVLNAASIIKKQGNHKKVSFIFIGEGAQKKYLKQRVQELQLDHVFLHDAISYHDSLSVLAKMDLTLIPLKKGGMYDLYLPVKLFESMAAGVPPLLCNAGEAGDIIKDSGCGAVFDSGAPGQLPAIISSYIDKSSELTQQGKQGREYMMRHFDRSTMALKYSKLFQNIIENKSGSGA